MATTQTPADLAASVGAADRDRYGEPARYATALDTSVLTSTPAALDPPPLPAILTTASDAQAMAANLLALPSPPTPDPMECGSTRPAPVCDPI